MKTKAIPIKMTPNTHYKLRSMAASGDMTQGQLIEVMVDSLNFRSNALMEQIKLRRRNLRIEKIFIQMIFALDAGELNEVDIAQYIEQVNEGADPTWTSEA